MTIKYRSLFLFVIIIFYIFIYFGGNSFFSETSVYDAGAITNLDPDDLAFGASYSVMAYIYNKIPNYLLDVISISIGFLFIFTVFKNSKVKLNLIVLMALIIIPCIFTISTFQKDLILVLFIVPVYFILLSKKNDFLKVFYCSIIYILYAIIFRNYYFLITFIFLFLYFFKISDSYIRLMFLFLIVIVFLVIPNDVYYSLQSSRDIVNANRVGFSGPGYRTAFKNPLSPTSFLNFIYNYIYALLRLNFGFFFNFGIKDLIFMFYLLTYYFFVFSVFFRKNNKNYLPAFLILSHALVYFLFEPDTGSYARHLSSTLPYLAIIITNKFNMKELGINKN